MSVPTRGQAAQAISNAVIRLMRDYTGRGPTQAQTTIAENHVIVVLRDTLLKAERSLVHDGQSEPVTTMRRRFQRTMEKDLVAAVVEHTGREVEAFSSDNHIAPDIAVEVFILKPRVNDATADGASHKWRGHRRAGRCGGGGASALAAGTFLRGRRPGTSSQRSRRRAKVPVHVLSFIDPPLRTRS